MKSTGLKLAAIIAAFCLAPIATAATATATTSTDKGPKSLVHITIVNNSSITLTPTGEGLTTGCIGGSLPPFFHPVVPNSQRDIDLIFIKYLPTCRFDVLPIPNILSYVQACHGVKENDTIVYTGDNLANLRCQVQ